MQIYNLKHDIILIPLSIESCMIFSVLFCNTTKFHIIINFIASRHRAAISVLVLTWSLSMRDVYVITKSSLQPVL